MRLSLAFQELATARIRKLGYEDHRVSDNQVLMHLDLAGSRITEIAARAKISKQAISKLVADLERRKIVVKVSDPSDERAQLVRFTSQGTRMMEDALEVVFSNRSRVRFRVAQESARRDTHRLGVAARGGGSARSMSLTLGSEDQDALASRYDGAASRWQSKILALGYPAGTPH